MGLKASQLTSAVNKTFSAVGDLASTATLSNRTATGYNFASGSVAITTTTSTVKVVITEKSLSNGRMSAKGLIKSTGSIDAYDTLTVGSDVYHITDSIDDGFVINVTLTKEA